MLRLRRRAYLDNNATTEVAPRVRRVMQNVLANCYGNPSSRYRIARAAAAVLEEAREDVAAAIGADPQEIIFTGSASEANNQILKTFAPENHAGRDTIVSTPIEHPSVLKTLEHLAGRGMRILFCAVDARGRVIPEQLAALVDARTALVCCMLANNETGVVQDIPFVAKTARQHGASVFVDCVQALGKMPLDVHALDIDYASFSAHKIHGPKGVGALYVRAGSPLFPLIHGGHQENGLRAGTEGLHNIAGFGAACREIPALLARTAQIARLRQHLAENITAILPAAVINTPFEHAVPNTLSVTFPGADNGDAIAFLDYHGIAVSAGSACNTQANEPSHVLKAIGLSDEAARQTLRFSLSAETTATSIRYAGRVLRDYLLERAAPVTMVNPTQLNEDMLFNEKLFILDIRNKVDRKLLKGLPGSHEAAFLSLHRYLDQIPRQRSILVVCQGGTDGPIAAYYLRSKGYRHVSFVMGGIVGWKVCQPDLYKRLGDTGMSALSPGKKTP